VQVAVIAETVIAETKAPLPAIPAED